MSRLDGTPWHGLWHSMAWQHGMAQVVTSFRCIISRDVTETGCCRICLSHYTVQVSLVGVPTVQMRVFAFHVCICIRLSYDHQLRMLTFMQQIYKSLVGKQEPRSGSNHPKTHWNLAMLRCVPYIQASSRQ